MKVSKHLANGALVGLIALVVIGGIAATPIRDLVLQGNMDAGGHVITNLGTSTNLTSAVTRGYVETNFLSTNSISGILDEVATEMVMTPDTFFERAGGGGDASILLDFLTPQMPLAGEGGVGVISLSGTAMISSGTNSNTATTPRWISEWWAWIKTQAQTIAGHWTFSGSVTTTGNTTLGDASGDTLVIYGGTVEAPNATHTGSNRLANVGSLDGRHGVTYRRGSTSAVTFNNTATLADVSGSEITGIAPGLYWVRLFTRWFQASGTPGVKFQLSGSNIAVNPRGVRINNSNNVSVLSTMIDEVAVSTTTGGHVFILEGWMSFTGPGSLQLRAAQNAATEADTTLSGFMLSLEKVD